MSSPHGYPERNVVASLYCLIEPRVLQIFLPGLTYSSEYTVARNPEVKVMVPHVEEEGGGVHIGERMLNIIAVVICWIVAVA